MNKKILLLGIALLPSVFALYAGECMEVDLSELESLDDVVYFVVGNSSNMEGLNITLNKTTQNVSLCFALNFQPDSFTIVFIDNSTKEVIKEIHHHSRRNKYIDRNITQNETIYITKYETEYIDNQTIQDLNNTIDKLNNDLEKIKNKHDTLQFIFGFILIIALVSLLRSLQTNNWITRGLRKNG